jgi:hypothetical protein
MGLRERSPWGRMAPLALPSGRLLHGVRLLGLPTSHPLSLAPMRNSARSVAPPQITLRCETRSDRILTRRFRANRHFAHL